MSINAYTARVHASDPGQPLVFALHGTGGDENQFFDLARRIMPGAGVVAPRGDVSEMGAARFFRRTGEGIYDMTDLAARTEKMADFVQAFAQSNPGAPIYGFGYSNGANILASVAFRHPELFCRLGLLHPLIPWTPEPAPALAGRSVLITAGRSDPICPWPTSERLIDWFAMQGARVETRVHDGGHELRSEELQALARLISPATADA